MHDFMQRVFTADGPKGELFSSLKEVKDTTLDLLQNKDLHDDVSTFLEAANEIVSASTP
jgi:hypothetical protein